MRSFGFLSLVGLAFADPTQVQQGVCLVDSGEAVSDALDSAMFMWAASKRCGKKGLEVKCAVDVSSAIKSLNSMINVIVRTVDECDGLHTMNKQCGMQAGKMTAHLAGLAAAGADVDQKCVLASSKAILANNGLGSVAAPVLCSVNLKNTAKNMFKLVNEFQQTKSQCNGQDGESCASNALHIVGAFSAIGQWLAGTAGQCERAADSSKSPTRGHLCAQASLALVEYMTKIADDGILLSRQCNPTFPTADVATEPSAGAEHIMVQLPPPEGASRLYAGEFQDKRGGSSFTINLVLGALLPVAAVFGFVGGKKVRRQDNFRRSPVFSDHE